jgi:hypothetical protein
MASGFLREKVFIKNMLLKVPLILVLALIGILVNYTAAAAYQAYAAGGLIGLVAHGNST